jgi:glycosyltransferase involved in cell wall biosynthesis
MALIPHGLAHSPDLSFIMPCYNEEGVVGYTIPRLVKAFRAAGHRLELIAVDNGSRDRTGELLRELAVAYPEVLVHRVEKNEGYGNGVLSGIPLCSAPWVGIIPADGQVDAEDVVRLFDAARITDGRVVAKVRRRFRMDGWQRKIIWVGYNMMVRLLWPSLGTVDVNGTPKLVPRHALLRMRLESKQWFLDPELMLKAHYMGLRELELNVFARMRGNGLSHVRPAACWEFFRKLMAYRFGGLREWRRGLEGQSAAPRARLVSAGPVICSGTLAIRPGKHPAP